MYICMHYIYIYIQVMPVAASEHKMCLPMFTHSHKSTMYTITAWCKHFCRTVKNMSTLRLVPPFPTSGHIDWSDQIIASIAFQSLSSCILCMLPCSAHLVVNQSAADLLIDKATETCDQNLPNDVDEDANKHYQDGYKPYKCRLITDVLFIKANDGCHCSYINRTKLISFLFANLLCDIFWASSAISVHDGHVPIFSGIFYLLILYYFLVSL